MAEDGRVVVGCSRGEQNPDSVAVSYLIAGAALDQGRDVVLWLTSFFMAEVGGNAAVAARLSAGPE